MAFVKCDNKPLYQQLEEDLRVKIETGELRPGQRLPSEVELQEDYQMSRVTVRRAINKLEEDGLIEKIQGKGTFVAETVELNSKVVSFTNLYEKLGKKVTTEVISAGVVVGKKEECDFWGLPEGSNVLEIRRIRKVDDFSAMVEINILSLKFADVLKYDLTQSLYNILTEKLHVIPIKKSHNELSVVYAEEKVAKELQVEKGHALIYNSRTVHDEIGNPIHIGYDFVRADKPDIFKYIV